MFKNLKKVFSLILIAVLSIPVISVQAAPKPIPIIAPPTATQSQMETWAKNHGATDTFIGLAKLYYTYAPSHGGIDPVVAYAQAAKETAFGNFGGVIDASFNNPCGLKITNGGDDTDPAAHQRFASWTEGVTAHLDHLALYAGAAGYPKADGQTSDPRHFPFLYGTAGNSVASLGAKWAPSSTYGAEVINYINEINNNFYAAKILPNRLSGLDRFATAVQISASGWTTSDNVILAYGLDFPDALSGVSLGYIKDAPILLTESKSIPQCTLAEITRLQAKNVFILGGNGVVTPQIENTLKAKNLNVVRLQGTDRFQTAVAISNEVMKSNTTKTAVIATGLDYPDTISISPYAAFNKYPILYTFTNELNSDTKNFLIKYGIKNVIIPGGTGVVSANVESQIKALGIAVSRVFGQDRYQTAVNITTTFSESFKSGVFITIGSDFPDGLTGGVLAAKRNMPMLLVEKNSIDNNTLRYIKSNGDINLYVLGGTGVISDNLINQIKN
ncbi:cell wall-binding repeat-containing protein [Clostridium sp. 'White wine YQ']|uniref:cell wall-binding repeat-containing protein n=1 Tax=Clostridium sp. 'White wine YQ' TaxID=3027474 RepID=UPI0023669CBE|nr:cell wall-binding repeat-containing protein [Clostridium sp. 'White wine YQ']MDD7792761.1 cell wall-binding repeat-containing protein [Clostridium sp. 'White wine YQ']